MKIDWEADLAIQYAKTDELLKVQSIQFLYIIKCGTS